MSKKNESFQDLLDRLEINDWDMVLIGDGSGSRWDYPIGWAVTAVFKAREDRKVFYGAMNDGTVNIAESMAYMHALLWYLSEIRKQRDKSDRITRHVVHIITDSEYVKEVGKKGKIDNAANQPIWAAMALVKRQGIQLVWHWARRNDIMLNTYADIMSKKSRQLFKDNELRRLTTEDGLDPDLINPWE